MTIWKITTEERYDEMLGVLPPAAYSLYGFLVGEPMDHDREGWPRFSAFVEVEGKFYESKQPLTAREFKAFSPKDLP